MSVGTSVAIAGGLTAVLAALHIFAGHLRRLPLVPEPAMASFAGGIAVAYVFLHLLPELAEGNERVGEVLADTVRPTPLVDLGIFLVALTGFVAFYGLERAARRHSVRGRAEGDPPGTSSRATFALHLGSFLAYNAIITYTMPLRVRTGVAFAVLFTVAMGLHFVLTDRGLEEHYPDRFTSRHRVGLAAALVIGFLLGWAAAPSHTVVVSLLVALLGGAVLLNVFKEELPDERSSLFGWFVGGVALYGGLLAAITAVG